MPILAFFLVFFNQARYLSELIHLGNNDIRKVQSTIRRTEMRVIQGGPDLDRVVEGVFDQLTGWLTSVNITPKQFCKAMRESGFAQIHTRLGLTESQFFDGINNIHSLELYALLLEVSRVQLWAGFEANGYVAPQWLIEVLEEDMRDSFTTAFVLAGAADCPLPSKRPGPSAEQSRILDAKVMARFASEFEPAGDE
jgi:hypothetical protein